jgi:hypothetical protein
MPKVSVAIPHQHDPDEVVRRAQPYIEKMIEDFEGEDLSFQWAGRQGNFTFTSLMFKIKGDVQVTSEAIRVDIDLPFAAMIFKDKIEKAIHKNLTRALEAGQKADQE